VSMFPIETTKSDLRMAHKPLNATDGKIPTSSPATRKDVAHGRIPISGVLTVEVSDPSADASVTLKIWSVMQSKWVNPGSTSTNFSKSFLAANNESFDYFTGPAGALYYLQSTVADIQAWDNGDAV